VVYLIQVPPWKVIPGPNAITMEAARSQLIAWAAAQGALFPAEGFPFQPRVIYRPAAGTLIFTALLTPKQAQMTAKKFRYLVPGTVPGPKNLGTAFIFDPDQPIQVPAAPAAPPASATPTWAAKVVTPLAINTLPSPQPRVPVLYVVDTGVQLWVKPGSPGTMVPYHPQFAPAVNNGKLVLRQGCAAPTSNLYEWPPGPLGYPAPAGVTQTLWNTPADTVMTLPSTGVVLWNPQNVPPECLDPHRDQIGHGTKVLSTAIGASTGTTWGIPGLKVEVESIRIYGATNQSTVTEAIDGISMAVASHNNRKPTDPNAASVLLFASRTVSGFSDLLELNLWWAWYAGLVVVASGGNEPAAYAPGQFSPDSRWVSHTPPDPTSPSRYDPRMGPASDWPTTWGTPPTAAYPGMILVGGTNAAKTSAATKEYGAYGGGSSRGTAIDILAPHAGVPCANVVTTYVAPGLVDITGSSLSTGFVAGAALARLAATTAATANDVRDWMFPSAGPGSACAYSTATAANASPTRLANSALPAGFVKVPKLKVTAI
jgi:hypothetical protein